MRDWTVKEEGFLKTWVNEKNHFERVGLPLPGGIRVTFQTFHKMLFIAAIILLILADTNSVKSKQIVVQIPNNYLNNTVIIFGNIPDNKTNATTNSSIQANNTNSTNDNTTSPGSSTEIID